MSDWTRDAAGEYVRWNEAPYYVDGVLNILLEGETMMELDIDTVAQRNHEYHKLRTREMRK